MLIQVVVGAIMGPLNETAGAVGLSELGAENDGLDKVKVDQSFITTKDIE